MIGSWEEVTQCIYHICCALLDSPARGDTRMYRPDSGYSDVDGRGSSRMSDRDSRKDRSPILSDYGIRFLKPLLILPEDKEEEGVEEEAETTATTEIRNMILMFQMASLELLLARENRKSMRLGIRVEQISTSWKWVKD